MQIIVVSGRLRQARSVTISKRHVIGATLALALVVTTLSAGVSYVTMVTGLLARVPGVEHLIAAIHGAERETEDQFVRANISALAVRLGEMQAQITRLDVLGERLNSMVGGSKSREVKVGDVPGRGGSPEANAGRALSVDDLTRELARTAQRIDLRADDLKVVEDEVLRDRVRQALLPTAKPVNVAYIVSGFGTRIDPFSGRAAMHEGVDFAAPVGTPILAAAAGFVITSEFHPAYGNMVEIDHGSGRTTRYAHASKLHVKVGERVKAGQHIADVGSTGHSTGPHLHFEVRENGAAINPSRFLVTASK